jgi:hypothetical protein
LISFVRRARASARHRWRLHRHGVKRDALFVWIPKTAGTSAFDALKPFGFRRLNSVEAAATFEGRGFVTFGHMSIRHLVEADLVPSDFVDRAFVYTFVRDPYERAASLFHQMRRRERVRDDIAFEEFLELVRGGVEPLGLYNSLGLSPTNTQMSWLRTVSRPADFIGRFERLDDDFRAVCRQLGVHPPDLPHRNSRSADAPVMFDRATRRLVEEIYEEDFVAFGYPTARRPG